MKKLTVAVTVDDRMGIAFNKRRQSRDKALIDDLCKSTNDKIYTSSYSAPLFEKHMDKITVVNDPLSDCPDNACCFIELMPLSAYAKEISCLIIYKWNRTYPRDKLLGIDAAECGLNMTNSYDFIGNSHDVITKEIYNK